MEKPEKKEIVLSVGKSIVIVVIFALLFYESMYAVIPLIPVGIILFRLNYKREMDKRKNKIILEFRAFCVAMSSNLAAGYSLENAMCNSVIEMDELFGKKYIIRKPLVEMIREMKLNIPAEQSFAHFAELVRNDRIQIFSDVLQIARRSSGNLVEVIKEAADGVSDSIDLQRQIDTIFASKKYEQTIMNVIPFGIILYVKISSPGLLDVLYQGILGRGIMTVCLGICLFAFYLSNRIMEIKM